MRGRRLILGFVMVATVGAGTAVALTANAIPAPTTTYEAEAAEVTRTGGARVLRCGACSGGLKVGYVGNNSGVLRFDAVTASATGSATVTIAYATGASRSAQLSVNGGADRTISFPSTGGFGRPGTLAVTVTLDAGVNTLRFANRNGWAPDFDKITVVSADTPPPDDNAAAEAAVVALVNQERASVGCQPLALDDRLVAAARGHSADMAVRGYLSHTTPEGVEFATRITNAGYEWSGAGENIAKGQRTAAEVMDAWMGSPGHRSNILNCGFQHIGVGLAYDSGNTAIWTQDFASPL